MPRAIKDITGQRFGKLVAVEAVGKSAHGVMRWLCQCDCGNSAVVLGGHLRNEGTRSCGCLRRNVSRISHTTHGMARTKAWYSWVGMIQRCYNSKNPRYKDWGGRGITVCDRWMKFENFFADMGERQDGLSLDRIDTNGNYEPNNCRWATVKQQRNNRRIKLNFLDISG